MELKHVYASDSVIDKRNRFISVRQITEITDGWITYDAYRVDMVEQTIVHFTIVKTFKMTDQDFNRDTTWISDRLDNVISNLSILLL
jgi:hypothetical protein